MAGDGKDVHRPGDVLQLDFPLVHESNIELVTHLIVDLPRDRNTTGISDALDAGSNVHAVAHQIIALHNDVADMDADAQRQSPLRVGLLDCLRRLYRLHGTGELDQEAVAYRLKQPPGMLDDCGLDDIRAQRLELGQRSRLVTADELRVADDVGDQDRGEAALLGHRNASAALGSSSPAAMRRNIVAAYDPPAG